VGLRQGIDFSKYLACHLIYYMFRQTIWALILTMLTISCKRNIKQEPVSMPERKLQIKCENERLLIENPANSLGYSFDTIGSTRSYWKNIRHDQERSMGHRLYPFTSISTDTPSLYNKLNIALVGPYDWGRDDGKFKTMCYGGDINTIFLNSFLKKVSVSNRVTEDGKNAEIFLAFYKDSIQDIKTPLKKITETYLYFQRENSQRLFQKDLCNLTIEQIDSLRSNVPFRIRLMRNLNSKGE
jgi:hypothetical protein